ncbi:hypothetical protein PENTCL1PPCAC_1625, partial [Pristionchus entomophagus]
RHSTTVTRPRFQMRLRTALLSLMLAITVVDGVPSGYRDDVIWPFGLDDGSPSSPLSSSSSSPSSPSPLDCSVACSSSLHSTLRSLFSAGTTVRGNLHTACSEYESALSCISSRLECDSHAAFDRLTSGLRFMCREQRDAFDAVIECADQHSQSVNEECQRSCRAETLLTGFALKDTLLKTLAPEVDAALTPNMMQFAINEGCRIGYCMLKCGRTKMNARCEGTAGSLFTEALVRPLANDAASDSDVTGARGPLSIVFSALLPTQCSFIFDDAKLRELRIGDEMNEDVRRMYAERKTTPRPEEALVNSIFDQPAATNPWKHDRYDNQHSPLVHTNKESVYDDFLKEIDDELEREESLLREDERRAWLRKIEMEGYDANEQSGEGSGEEGSGTIEEQLEEGSGEEVRQKRTVPITTTTPSSPLPSAVETTTLSEEERHSYEVDHPWMEVNEGSGGEPRPRPPRVFYDGSTEETTVIRLERTADNADLFMARRIEAARKYRIELRVAPEDQGELVCLLRTDKAHAVNRIPTKEDYELDELLNDL